MSRRSARLNIKYPTVEPLTENKEFKEALQNIAEEKEESTAARFNETEKLGKRQLTTLYDNLLAQSYLLIGKIDTVDALIGQLQISEIEIDPIEYSTVEEASTTVNEILSILPNLTEKKLTRRSIGKLGPLSKARNLLISSKTVNKQLDKQIKRLKLELLEKNRRASFSSISDITTDDERLYQ